MNPINCELSCLASTPHLSHLYAGFGELNRLGLIKITVKRNNHYEFSGTQGLIVTVNNKTKIFYDLFDGAKIFSDYYEESDFYFKRSFDRNLHKEQNIFPLGLNYPVTNKFDFAGKRFYWDLKKTKKAKNIVLALLNLKERKSSAVGTFEGLPVYETNPKIIFFVRLWSPEKTLENSDKTTERNYINKVRTDCIRRLRKEFGSNFVGGVYPTEYAVKNFGDCVINKSVAQKSNYLKLLNDSEICVATMGLRRSNGFKLAEYVAGAKAIVSEKLHFQPTGNFESGINYLEFNNADECLQRVAELFDDPQKRFEMKKTNYRYYHEYLRPDVLVWNSLQTVCQNIV